MTKRCDTHDTVFLGLVSSELHFFQKIGTVLLAALFLKKTMYYLFGHFVGNTILPNVTEVSKIAISFHCDTQNTFSTHFCRASAGVNVKILDIECQNIESWKDSEKICWSCFDEFEISGILCCFKRKNIPPVL